jgi:serine/threonine protein kinase
VKYVDNIQTKNKLYIMIEYVLLSNVIYVRYLESGSLQDIVKKYGAMKEPLAAMYVAQVLEGLEYLHAEGISLQYIK